MSRKETFRRYVLFLCSVLVNAFSIAVITKALLGTSPISSVPYVLSLFTPMTMGQYTIIMNFFFILLEVVLMKRSEVREKRYELMAQVPVTLCFGLFIDVSMHLLLPWLSPDYYLSKVCCLIVGCFLLGVGISLEVKANVAMVTGEYLVQVISRFLRREFGFVKVLFDVTLVLISCVLSLCFLGGIDGIREGTIIAALTVGPISHLVTPCWRFLDRWLSVTPPSSSPVLSSHQSPLIVTIAREFGSGGHLLGEMLAQRLGIPFYDKSLITLAAQESQLPEQYVSDNEQRMSSNFLLNAIWRDYEAPLEKSLCPDDAIFVAQSRIIRQKANGESCIIVGRCADYILQDVPSQSIIRVFCYTDIDDACRRCISQYHIAADRAKSEIQNINRARINHYQYYTSRKWGDPHNYDLIIHTGHIGLQAACDLIAQLYARKAAQLEQ